MLGILASSHIDRKGYWEASDSVDTSRSQQAYFYPSVARSDTCEHGYWALVRKTNCERRKHEVAEETALLSFSLHFSSVYNDKVTKKIDRGMDNQHPFLAFPPKKKNLRGLEEETKEGKKCAKVIQRYPSIDTISRKCRYVIW